MLRAGGVPGRRVSFARSCTGICVDGSASRRSWSASSTIRRLGMPPPHESHHLLARVITSLSDSARRRRLEDTRTYSAGVQAEVLLTAGLMHDDTYSKVQSARKTRNDFAHRGVASADGAAHGMEAMRAMVSLLGVRIDRLSGFSYQSGGIGSPATELEPEFRFH